MFPYTLLGIVLSLLFISDSKSIFFPTKFRCFLPTIIAFACDRNPSSSFECFKYSCLATIKSRIVSPKNSSRSLFSLTLYDLCFSALRYIALFVGLYPSILNKKEVFLLYLGRNPKNPMTCIF
jgi:hypothetical protein